MNGLGIRHSIGIRHTPIGIFLAVALEAGAGRYDNRESQISD
jgi:hypothetical protein